VILIQTSCSKVERMLLGDSFSLLHYDRTERTKLNIFPLSTAQNKKRLYFCGYESGENRSCYF
jgi:hypothetical protein